MKSFHSFRLDAANHCVWKGETRLPLAPKAFDLLRYLVERPGRLIPQEEILEALWTASYVNPEIVKKYILGIRKALGDQRDSAQFIETVPRRGYRFIAPVREEGSRDSAVAPSRIVGRMTARAELDGCLHKSLSGHRQLCFLAGEPGAGKTALAESFEHGAVVNSNVCSARGHCLAGVADVEPYYPLLDALGQLIRAPRTDTVLQVLTRHAPTWAVQFPGVLGAKQRELLRREVLGARRERMLREICDALETLSSSFPLLLILEDLHWSDASTLDFIAAIARRRTAARLMLVATYRTHRTGEAGSRLTRLRNDLLVHELASEIPLEPLREREVGEYLTAELTGANPSAELVAYVYQHSAGNPLFMAAVAQELQRGRWLSEVRGEWRLPPAGSQIDLGVPQTLQKMLQLQLEQLGDSEQSTVRAASVAGQLFSAWELAAPLERDLEDIEAICEHLADRAQFIRSAGMRELPDGTVSAHFEFLHALHREFIYGGISPVARSRLHRGIAMRLASLPSAAAVTLAGTLALHFEEGREYQRAIDYTLLAAQTATRRFAHRESIALLRHALELIPRVTADARAPLRLQILERIGDAHYALGEMAESVAAHELQAAAASEVAMDIQRVHALMCQARPLGLVDPDRAVAVMDQARALSERTGDKGLHLRTRLMAAVWRLLYGMWRDSDYEEYAALQPAADRAPELRLSEHDEMFCLYVECLCGKTEAAARAAGAKTLETPSLMGYFGAAGVHTLALLFLGRFGDALQIIRDGRAAAEKSGYESWLFLFREAALRTLAFDFEGALRVCDSIIRGGAHVPPGQPATIARLAQGYLELEQGRYEDAARQFELIRDAEGTPKFFLHWYWRMQAQLGLAEVGLSSNRLSDARSAAKGLLANVGATLEPTLGARAWEVSARAAAGAGEFHEAHSCIERALAITERFQPPLAAWHVHATAADLMLQLQPELAQSHLRRAREGVQSLIDSLPANEPLRTSLLTARPVRRVLE